MVLLSNETGFLLQTFLYFANYDVNNTLIDTIQLKNITPKEYDVPEIEVKDLRNQVKCYGVYGCFPLTEPWLTKENPIPSFPLSPMELNVKFAVFNQKYDQKLKYLDIDAPEEVKNLGINPRGKIYFVTHGYIESGDQDWIVKMKNVFLKGDQKATCIIVDWSKGASPPYLQTIANIRLVGAMTAHVINLLYEELGLENIDMVHLIGHSLGSHMMGYAGHYLQNDFNLKVGRITGMDPAEPFFVNVDPLARLDISDAKFVDIIHTDALPFIPNIGLGMYQAIGHVDFYPNGGFDQPGCKQTMMEHVDEAKGSLYYGLRMLVACNHIRSHQFFTESISRKCPFLSITCESYDKFKQGECMKCDENGHLCIEFGLASYEGYQRLVNTGRIKPGESIASFFQTQSNEPFCRYHYKVEMKIATSNETLIPGSGSHGILWLTIHGHYETSTPKLRMINAPMYLEQGRNYSKLFLENAVGIPIFATIEWEYKANFLELLLTPINQKPKIFIEYLIVESLEHSSSIKLCPSARNATIMPGFPKEFHMDNCFN